MTAPVRATPTPLRRGLFILGACIALGGCKPRDTVMGSPEPPASFGPLAKTRGCPTLAGVYAWPPVEGAPQGYAEGGIPIVRKYPDFLGASRRWEGEFTIQDPDEPRRHFSITSRPHGVILKRYLEAHHRCDDGWRVLAEHTHPELEAPKEYGAPVSIGVKLATLANGDLVVGQWLRKDGGKGSLFPWGDSGSRGNWIPLADEVTWYWSRYRRIAATR